MSQVPLTLDFLNHVYWPCKKLFHRLFHQPLPLTEVPKPFPLSSLQSKCFFLRTSGHFWSLLLPTILPQGLILLFSLLFFLYFSILNLLPQSPNSVAVWEDCNLEAFLETEGRRALVSAIIFSRLVWQHEFLEFCWQKGGGATKGGDYILAG